MAYSQYILYLLTYIYSCSYCDILVTLPLEQSYNIIYQKHLGYISNHILFSHLTVYLHKYMRKKNKYLPSMCYLPDVANASF